MFELREYQKKCVDTILGRFKESDAQIVQLPTGSGKTVILWHVLKILNKKALIVAPTRELTEQIEETGRQIVDPEQVYLKKKSYFPTEKQFLVMTGQAATFGLKGTQLMAFKPKVLVVDEAHRGRSKTIEDLITRLRAKGCKILGLTATPERLDGKNLLDVFDQLTFSRNLVDLINQGYLVDLECFKIKTKHKIKEFKYQKGDISPASLRELDVDSRNKIILDIYKDFCKKKKTLVFCLNIAHSEKIANLFLDNGIRAMSIHGGLSRTKRQAIIRSFKEGDIDVLCNCQLLTEGFDEPSIEALILSRPTKSRVLYCQMVGRGVRPFKGKKSCLVLDMGDEIHNICTFNVLGGIPRESDFEFKKGEKLTDAVKREKLSVPDIEYHAEKHDYYERNEINNIPALSHQKSLMRLYNIPFLEDIKMDEAAYLLFKTALMRHHGYNTDRYWKEWRTNVQGTGSYQGDTLSVKVV